MWKALKRKLKYAVLCFFCNSDMDQLSDKPKEIAGASGKTDALFAQETFSEGVLTRNRTSSITKSPAVPRPRTRSLSGSSQSDILTPEAEKQSPGAPSLLKRGSVPAKPEQLVSDLSTKGRRRRRTKAQIAADNAAKQALLELEKKDAATLSSLPISKKPGRPRGRPKKIRTPVDTPTSTVANSPASSLQNEEPLPSNVSNQESLESPNADQETTKSSNESSYDFDVSTKQNSIDNVTLPPSADVALLKEDELTFKEDTPLLKEDITPPPVTEAKTPHSSDDKDVMVVVEEQSTEECEKVAAKTTEQPSMSVEVVQQQGAPEDDPSSQPTTIPDDISAETTTDGELAEKPIEETLVEKSMDTSPSKATPAEAPFEKTVSSANTLAPDPVVVLDPVVTAEEKPSNFPTDNDEMMDTESTAITTTALEASTQICTIGSSANSATLTNAESIFVNSFLTTCAVTAVSNSTNNAMSAVSLNMSSSGANIVSNSATTVASSVISLKASSSSSTPAAATTAAMKSNSTKTVTFSAGSLDAQSSSSTTVNNINTKSTTSFVSLSSSSPVNNSVTKTVTSLSVSSSGATTVSNNNTVVSSTGAIVVSTVTTKDVTSSVISLDKLSSEVSGMNSGTKNIMSTAVSSTTPSSAATASLASQSVQSTLSTIPSVSLTTSTLPAPGVATVSDALSKISSQSPFLTSGAVSIATTNTGVAGTSKPTGTSASTNIPRDVAKLDPLPINLNTSLSVTLPTLSSLLTTPSGQQKLVLPLEKLVLPSNLETAATTGAFISSPPLSKPSHSCSYVITSMQMKDADPVSLAVSTMAQSTKESNLHSVSSQKVVTTSHASSVTSLESKRSEPTNTESKLREIAPKTLGFELHHLTSDIGRSSAVKRPELYEVLSIKPTTVNKSMGNSESKLSSFSTSAAIASIVGQSSGKEKLFDQNTSGQVIPTDKDQQHKPRPIAIKPDGMDHLLRQIPAVVATSSRTYPTVHPPLFPITANNKGNVMSQFDLFRSIPTTQKQYSTAANISASVLPHLPGSSIAAYPTQKAPPPLISITDGPNQTVLGSVRVKVIDAPASAHQSLSSLPAHMKVSRPRPLPSQQSSVSAPIVTTTLVSVTGGIPALSTTYSSVSQQQYMPHPLTIGVHASTSNKVPSTADLVMVS